MLTGFKRLCRDQFWGIAPAVRRGLISLGKRQISATGRLGTFIPYHVGGWQNGYAPGPYPVTTRVRPPRRPPTSFGIVAQMAEPNTFNIQDGLSSSPDPTSFGPVAQRREQEFSKLKAAGLNPAGIAKVSPLYLTRLLSGLRVTG